MSAGPNQANIDDIRQRTLELSTAGDKAAAWAAVAPLLESNDKAAATALLDLVANEHLSHEHALAALDAIQSKHADDIELIGLVGENLDRAINIDFLNAAPLDHPIFPRVISILERAWRLRSFKKEATLLDGLGVAARLFGRQRDDLAERAYRRLIELEPETHYRHYNLGLFFKTRGRFEEGMHANQKAVDLAKNPSEGAQWNLGICATGARRGDVALNVWKKMGHKIELGRFGLPDGRFSSCKVRLAERPLAARTSADDDPGQEETIWIERLSACHGIVRSVLYYDLGVDYGDVVMFDGAPLAYHKYDDDEIPVFPHLVTLIRRNYQFFDFAGTQDEAHRLNDVNKQLAGDIVVYSHTDQFVTLCADCWNDPNTNHARHDKTTKNVIIGRIAAPPDVDPADLLSQIDTAAASLAPSRIFAPNLCEAAGQPDRARIEQRRFDMLVEDA